MQFMQSGAPAGYGGGPGGYPPSQNHMEMRRH